jgi:hypothetical protein
VHDQVDGKGNGLTGGRVRQPDVRRQNAVREPRQRSRRERAA